MQQRFGRSIDHVLGGVSMSSQTYACLVHLLVSNFMINTDSMIYMWTGVKVDIIKFNSHMHFTHYLQDFQKYV